MDQDRKKRIDSAEMRRSSMGGETSFGPKETEETLLFSQLKKINDQEHIKNSLDQ